MLKLENMLSVRFLLSPYFDPLFGVASKSFPA
jgi:hypothetical protein